MKFLILLTLLALVFTVQFKNGTKTQVYDACSYLIDRPLFSGQTLIRVQDCEEKEILIFNMDEASYFGNMA